MAMEMIQITEFLHPDDGIKCEFGYCSVRDWLNKEVARIMKNPSRSAEIRELRGKVALYVDNVCPGRIKK